MTTAPPVVFCVYREAAGPVFSSQVVGPVNWLVQQGLDVSLVSFVPVGTWLRGTARRSLRLLQQSVRNRLGDKALWLPAAPSRMRFDPVAVALLAVWLRRHYGKLRVVLHCRGSRMTELGLKVRQCLPNVVVVFDCRGVDHAEFRYEKANTGVTAKKLESEYQRRLLLQKRCVLEADKILCVSEAMACYLESEYGIGRECIHVIPCLVDVDRFVQAAGERDRVRAELGLQGKFVVTYSGSLHAWQMPDQCLRMFQLIRECRENAHFFALTTEPDAMRALAQKHGLQHKDFTLMRVSYEQVPYYLAAGDIGLLLREPSLVNKVASPVKFGEYLAAGLPLIMTEGIGDYSEWVRNHSVGVVYEYGAKKEEMISLVTKFLERYFQKRDVLQMRCQNLARRKLSYPRNMDLPNLVYCYD